MTSHMTSKYSYIFEEVISTSTTREKVKLIIPILIGWAKAGLSNMTYALIPQHYYKYNFLST